MIHLKTFLILLSLADPSGRPVAIALDTVRFDVPRVISILT